MSDSNLFNQLLPVIQVRQQVVRDFIGRRNVVACGVGYKIKGQQQTDIPSIVVSVTHKQPSQELPPGDLIPGTVNSIPTDVIETGEIEAFGLDRRLALRPVRPGTSIGHQNGTTGTLGCIVQRGSQRFILSNNHVLAMLNQANPGDLVLQPGAADGGTALDAVGQLATFIPVRFLDEVQAEAASASAQSTEPQGCSQWLKLLIDSFNTLRHPVTAPPAPPEQPDNHVDVALATPLNTVLLDPAIVDLGGPPLGTIEPQLGMRVVKSGRTTGITEATIIQIDVTVNVKYGDRLARFGGQMMTTPFSQPGDSGSLVLDFERRAVGLLFSGSPQITVLNPINQVLAALDVELVTSDGSPAGEFG